MNKQFKNTTNDFKTHFTKINITTRQMIHKELEDFNNILYQVNLKGIYRKLYPNTADNIFFSRTQRTFSRIDRMLYYNRGLKFLN